MRTCQQDYAEYRAQRMGSTPGMAPGRAARLDAEARETGRLWLVPAHEIHTERLVLRRWRPEDRAPFAALNCDPEVVAYLPGRLSRTESDAFAERIEAHFEEHGFGLWAIQVVGGALFIGYVGLAVPRFDAHFTPCVEVGWRLARGAWGRGYATEGALAALHFGFDVLGLDEIVSFTVPDNARSRAVLERIGMTRRPEDDFEHPSLPEGHPLRRHALYRITPACMHGRHIGLPTRR